MKFREVPQQEQGVIKTFLQNNPARTAIGSITLFIYTIPCIVVNKKMYSFLFFLVNIEKGRTGRGSLSLRIIVDGYNFIGADEGLSINLHAQRAQLIERLSVYQKIREIPVCVVFDAWKQGMFSQSFEMQKGVEVIFSRLGEKADQVIIRLVKRLKEQCIVISSDREIRNVADQEGATSLTIGEFQRKLDQADKILSSGEMEAREEESPSREKKGGNPNKLSKKERAKKAKLKKL